MTKRVPARVVIARRPRPWGMIGAATTAAVVAGGIIGYGAYASWRGNRPWNDRLAAMAGVTDYAGQKPVWLTQNHKGGDLSYPVTPSVGGDHNSEWQSCTGNVYDAPIAAEHATHSLEHGAVWITYKPGLDAAQVQRLARRVTGQDYTLMSPHDGLPSNVTVQAWGYQLAVDTADDDRIDTFITAARIKAGPEQGATCSGGNSTTGTEPHEEGQ